MKILFIASECTPIAKVGGLGDVIGSLPKAIFKLGCDVRIAIPKYQIIDFGKYKFELVAKDIIVKDERVNVYQGFLPRSRKNFSLRGLPESKVPIYLLENEKYLGENEIYFEKTAFVDSFKEIKRFLFFSQAVLEIFPAINWWPQIIHCHDWHTAILPALAKLQIQNSKTEFPFMETRGKKRTKFSSPIKIQNLLTIHNLANQGKWEAREVLEFLNLKGNEIESLKIRDREGNFNILEQGILNADILNTVSKTYSHEIQTKEYGEGLEDCLLKRKKNLYGILNGIDETRFNPETDPDLKTNYSSKNLERKIENKISLQEILNFSKNSKIPLLGFIGRLTSQKGIDLMIEIIPEIVKLGCQLVILGVGKEDYEKKLLELSQKYPKNVSSQIKFDPVLAQKIYGGVDIFLMPSKFEPCGLGQMISMRYGTIPVVRKTGGLSDTVENKKTGFVFKKYKSEELLKTLKEALNLYKNQKDWKKLIKRAMAQDFSWTKSAKEYLKLYQILAVD